MMEEAASLDRAEPVWHRGGGGSPHTTTIRGKRVRFYDSPQVGPDWPWVSFADAIALMAFPMSFATEIADQWGRRWPAMQRELPCGTVIVPDFVVAGMFRFYADRGIAAAEAAAHDYASTAVNLFCRLHADLHGHDWRSFVQQAGLRNMPVDAADYAN